MGERLDVRDNPSQRRYELLLDGELSGTLAYRRRPGAVALIHTNVPPELEGRGLGARLVAGALADIRTRGLRVVPICPFVRAYIGRHPEHRDLVAGEADAPN